MMILFGKSAGDPLEVMVADVIGCIEKFDGKLVHVAGFITLLHENVAIYQSQGDGPDRGLWLDMETLPGGPELWPTAYAMLAKVLPAEVS